MKASKKGILLSISLLFTIFLLLGIVFLFPLTATAAEAEVKGFSTDNSLPDYVNTILNIIMGSAAGLAVMVIMFGGIYWMISLGRSQITSEGKEWIKAGILGLILTVCSYLILNTINPNIFSYQKFSFLPFAIPVVKILPTSSSNPALNQLSFDEIPIGTITESLVARGISCYDFNGSGEPIDGDLSTADIWEPTFTNHDRLDCILQLAEAVEAKSKLFTLLSQKIVEVMNKCSCGPTKGDCKVGECNCTYPGAAAQPGNSCYPTTCNSNCETTPCKGQPCCAPEDLEKIEHGPLTLDDNGCGGSCQVCRETCEKNYANRTHAECGKTCKNTCADDCKKSCEYDGLDEFRSQIADSDIINTVEKEITNKKIKVINKEAWGNLRLIDKLKYLKEKIKKIQESINQDLTNLKTAKTKLNTCYYVSSAVKFLFDSASVNKDTTNIAITNNFTDQITQKPVDNSKYCEGFGYNNSKGFYFCQNMCNPISEAGQKCFKGCQSCKPNEVNCLKDQKKCLSDCIDKQECIPGEEDYPSFNDGEGSCLSAYKESCAKACNEKYANCPTDLQNCLTQCENDSKSIITNKNRTYLATNDLKICADAFGDFTQFKKCAEFALQGKYCSRQNPGDPDVFVDPKKGGSLPNNGDYSSLYFYSNKKEQKCPDCIQKIKTKSDGTPVTNPETNKEIITTPGVQQYPECWKGPSCSYIPKAPCADDKCTLAGIEKLNLLNCSGTCEEFSYSGEPLTFYCAKGEPSGNWVKEKWQLYDAMTCAKTTEIPVGQTVDGAIAWAEKTNKYINDFLSKVEDMVQYIKDIGNEKNYCKCDSPCGDGRTACQADCQFFQAPWTDEDGNQIGVFCWCQKTSCGGHPCAKMIGLLLGKKPDDKCPIGTEYKGVAYYANQISEALKILRDFLMGQDRSEVLKRLNYSREKMDENSTKIKITPDKTLSMFSCYRVENKIYPITPVSTDNVVIGNKKITGYCYGEKVSAYLQPNNLLLDNWFSCGKQIQKK